MTDLTPTAAVLIIGNEILSGRTQDANLNYIAKHLADAGIKLAEARVVSDDEEEIAAAVNALRARYTHVFTTGGIGPTHDDMTMASIAKAFGRAVEENAEAMRRLLEHYGDPVLLNAARKRMAMLPQGAGLIDNPISAAPGAVIENVYVLPGVPKIMQAMLGGLLPQLQGGPPIISRSISGAVLEGQIAEELAAIATRYADLSIGSYPNVKAGRVVVTLVVQGTDEARVSAAATDILALVQRYDKEAA